MSKEHLHANSKESKACSHADIVMSISDKDASTKSKQFFNRNHIVFSERVHTSGRMLRLSPVHADPRGLRSHANSG